MMLSRKWSLALLAAVAIAAAGCSSSGDKKTAEVDPPKPKPPEVKVIAAGGSLDLPDATEDDLLALVGAAGQSQTLELEPGETKDREGVRFTCKSDYPCTVTFGNDLGTLVASWTSRHEEDEDKPMVMAALVPPAPINLFHGLNDADPAQLAAIINVGFGTHPTTLGGLKDGMIANSAVSGIGAANDAKITLNAEFDPNLVAANSMMDSGDSLAEDENAKKVDLPGWSRKALFADWGDSKTPERDGGFETGALIYSNIKPPERHPFDNALAARFADVAVRGRFRFTVDTDRNGTNDTLEFTVGPGDPAPGGNGTWVNAGATGPAALGATVSNAVDATLTRVEGRYFNASGVYTCANTCNMARVSGRATHYTLGNGTWRFTPNADATVEVPDQDWLAFGAWMTTPDDRDDGQHRAGVFFDGMDPFPAGTNMVGLTGTATYSGGAAGVYVDRAVTGMFTADATLTADFGDAQQPGTLGGRIDRFRNSEGVFLGTDIEAAVNSDGDSDWVVILNAGRIGDANDGIGVVMGQIGGSADGVVWAGGQWDAQFYGPGYRRTPVEQPTGVAGNFRANSGNAAAPNNNYRGVVGAFGAE